MNQDAASLKNNVRKLREDRLMSKAELARKSGLSVLTIDRVESGMSCRMDTKRKIILALGMTVAEKDQVFTHADAEPDEGASGGFEGQRFSSQQTEITGSEREEDTRGEG